MKSLDRIACGLQPWVTAIFLILPLATTDAAVRVDIRPIQNTEITLYKTNQQGGMTLDEAVEWVRSKANVDRILRAETRVSGGREVHRIRALLKSGVVRTYEVPGRRRG